MCAPVQSHPVPPSVLPARLPSARGAAAGLVRSVLLRGSVCSDGCHCATCSVFPAILTSLLGQETERLSTLCEHVCMHTCVRVCAPMHLCIKGGAARAARASRRPASSGPTDQGSLLSLGNHLTEVAPGQVRRVLGSAVLSASCTHTTNSTSSQCPGRAVSPGAAHRPKSSRLCEKQLPFQNKKLITCSTTVALCTHLNGAFFLAAMLVSRDDWNQPPSWSLPSRYRSALESGPRENMKDKHGVSPDYPLCTRSECHLDRSHGFHVSRCCPRPNSLCQGYCYSLCHTATWGCFRICRDICCE